LQRWARSRSLTCWCWLFHVLVPWAGKGVGYIQSNLNPFIHPPTWRFVGVSKLFFPRMILH
jgi:hypothetical protein